MQIEFSAMAAVAELPAAHAENGMRVTTNHSSGNSKTGRVCDVEEKA